MTPETLFTKYDNVARVGFASPEAIDPGLFQYFERLYFDNAVIKRIMDISYPRMFSEFNHDQRKADTEYFVEKAGYKFLGTGTSSLVLLDEQTNFAVSLTYNKYSPTTAHWIFYTHTILNTLFPQTFPKIPAVFGTNYLDTNTGSIREYVPHKQISLTHRTNTFERVWQMSEMCVSTGIPIVLDSNPDNLVKKNGQYIYLDIAKPSPYHSWNPQAMYEYMQHYSFDESSVVKVAYAYNNLVTQYDLWN